MLLGVGKLAFVGGLLLLSLRSLAFADASAGGCQPHQQVNPSLAGICRQNAETLAKRKAEYEELLKKKTESMQKSAAAFAGGDQTTEAAVENAKRMFSTMAAEQEALIKEVEKKRKDVGAVQQNYEDNLGKMMKSKAALVNEINQKAQFIATEKKALQELQMGRDPNNGPLIADKQKRLGAAESQLADLNKKRAAFDSAISADRASEGQAKVLAQKFKVSESELHESASKLRGQHARLSGVSLESNSQITKNETKLREEVAAEKAKLADLSEKEGSHSFNAEGKPAKPAEPTGSQKAVGAALAQAGKDEPMPNSTEAALVNVGKQQVADGKVEAHFKPRGAAETELMHAEQSLGEARIAVERNEKALAEVGGEKGLAQKLRESSKVYSGLEADVNGMPKSDTEGLKMVQDEWRAQYQKDCKNPAVCSALNSYGIKPEMTVGTGCVGSGICGVEKKTNWDPKSGLNDIPINNGEQVVKTENISQELRVAASRNDFEADAAGRLKKMNTDTMASAEEVKKNAELAVVNRQLAEDAASRLSRNEFCQANKAAFACAAVRSSQMMAENQLMIASGNAVLADPVSAGQVAALSRDPKVSAQIDQNVKNAAKVEEINSTTETALGFTPVAGSLYSVSEAEHKLMAANAAVVRTGGTSDVASNNLAEAKENLSSAKTMMAADVALSATGLGGAAKTGAKAVDAGVSALRVGEKTAVTPLLKSADNVAEAVVRDTNVATSRVKDDLITTAPRVAAHQDEAYSAARASANEEVRLNAYRNQSAREADIRVAEAKVAEVKAAEVKAEAYEDVRLNAMRNQSVRNEEIQIARQAQLQADEAAAVKSQAYEDVRLNAVKNQLARNEEIRVAQQAQAKAEEAFSTNRAQAFEDNRLNAYRNQSAREAEVEIAESKVAEMKLAAERSETAESLRLARQVEADKAIAEANAARAAQSEANPLRRQQEAAAKVQAANDNAPLPASRAKQEVRAGSDIRGGTGPKEITIYPDTVPDMLAKENIRHTPVDDTRAMVNPGPENKMSRTAAKVESKYGTKTAVDEKVDEFDLAGWANKDELTVARRTVRNKEEVGPLLSHEVEHVKNSSNLAKKVDQGESGFDWRNITFGSASKPTGIDKYDQMGIDEVMAYRRSYNQYRFDANAARKTGSNTLSESLEVGAESSAYQYGEKLRASTTYLRSADESLGKMMPAKLTSQEKTVVTNNLPLGAPARAAEVKSVTMKEITDSSGGSMRLVQTKYADHKSFTNMMVGVKGSNGKTVPMTVPVPDSIMGLPEKVAVKEARGYVNQALAKMDNYEILYQKSAAKKADIYSSYRKPAGFEDAPANPGVIGGDSGSRNLQAQRPSGASRTPRGLDDADSARASVPLIDEPSLIGQRATGAQVEFTPRALQEMADRRVNWVLKEHAEFSAITAADNRKFMDLAAKAEKGQAKESFFVTENAVLKRLNDDVVKNKDLVTALDNLHKDVLLREIGKDPVLKDVVVASYNDYKSIGLALKRNDPYIRRLLDEKIARANRGFDEFLKKVETANGWKEKSIGLASDMRTWHHSGIGNTFQEAGLAARRSRETALESGQARLVNFTDESAHYLAATDRLTSRSEELAKRFKSAPFLEKTPHGNVLSEEAIETIRKAKPLGKSEGDMNKAVQAAIGKRYGREISEQEATLLRSQLKDIDAVNPSLLIERRVEINMGLHDEGLVSFDFKGQNSRNLYQTQMAVMKTKGMDMKARLEAIADGDRIATRQLDDMKARVEKAVSSLGEKYVGKDVSKVVQKSGDDGIFHPLAPLGPAEKAKLAKALDEQKVGDSVRLTYLPKNYRNSDELIPVIERNRLVVEAEKIEKDLFTEHFVGKLPDDVFKGLQVKVDLVPAKEGKSAVGITFGHAAGKPIPAKAEEIALAALKDKYDIKVSREPASPTFLRSYSPQKAAKTLESADVYKSAQQWASDLDKMGAKISKMDHDTQLRVMTRHYKHEAPELSPMRFSDGRSRGYYGEVYRIDELPPPVAKGTAGTPALQHPQIKAYVEGLRRHGYELVTDTSMKFTDTMAYFSPQTRLISVSPHSTWAHFLHEVQHVEFYELISKHNAFEQLKIIRLEEKKDLLKSLDPEYVKYVGAEKIRQIQKLLDRGVTPQLAVDESLSVQAEMKALGWKRFIPGGNGPASYRYMLRHQITELEKLGPDMTEQQRKLVAVDKLKHTGSKVAELSAYPAAASGVAYGGYELYSYLTEENVEQVLYDAKGNAFVRRKDGSVQYITTQKK